MCASWSSRRQNLNRSKQSLSNSVGNRHANNISSRRKLRSTLEKLTFSTKRSSSVFNAKKTRVSIHKLEERIQVLFKFKLMRIMKWLTTKGNSCTLEAWLAIHLRQITMNTKGDSRKGWDKLPRSRGLAKTAHPRSAQPQRQSKGGLTWAATRRRRLGRAWKNWWR